MERIATGKMNTEFYMDANGINSCLTNVKDYSEQRYHILLRSSLSHRSLYSNIQRLFRGGIPYVLSLQALLSAFAIDCCVRQGTVGKGTLV